ncbi:MAG: hypothetical protein WA160_06495 [Pseudobdellovibrio sp.]
MPNFTHLPKALAISKNFDFRITASGTIAPWCLVCSNWVIYVIHESGDFEHQTIDGPQSDHCGIDLYTLKCHRVQEKFALYIYNNPVRWDRIG